MQQEAYDLGTQDAREQLEPQIAQLENQLELVQPLIQQLVQMRKDTLEQAAKDVAEIVLLVARRVVGDSLAYNPDALPTLVQAAISQMPDEDEITIRVAEDDVACVRDALDEGYHDRVVASDDIEAGCLVETKFSSIDSSLDAVVKGLEAAVAEWLESQNA
jgi:flagellar biosynthesis/type III secretory pathway protein FliH